MRKPIAYAVAMPLAFIAAWAARHYAIEPEAIAHACDPAPWSGACAARSLLIRSFATQGLGWLALAAGAFALVLRHPAAARSPGAARLRDAAVLVALIAGAAGLVLYCFEPAAVGVLLAGLAACAPRLAPPRPPQAP